MSWDALVEECKNIALKQLWDSIGRKSIVSLILYGSLARNEEYLSARDTRAYIESDMDLVVIIKNIDFIKQMASLTSLSDRITHDLRSRHLLSKVSLIVTTERRLMNAKPSVLILELKFNGKVIFGKDVISLLPNYSGGDVPVRHLIRYILPFMVRLLERFVQSYFDQNMPYYVNYDHGLKAMKKMTTGLIRAIVIKEGIPINPFNLNEIKGRKNQYHLEQAVLLESLFEIYEKLKRATDTDYGPCLSTDNMKEYWIEMINQFNLTVVALTGNKDFASEKLLFGDTVKLTRRLQLGLYISPRFLGLKKTRYLIKAVMLVITVGPDYSYLPLYRLFLSVPSLLGSDVGLRNNGGHQDEYGSRNTWKKSFDKNFEIWNLSSCIFADQF